jgi:hypothetical protein
MQITQRTVLEKLLELHKEKKRPIHIGDLKEAFNVIEKRDVVRSHGWRKTDKIEYALRELFRKGRLSRSEKQVKLENYPASPYASVKSKTVNVYFYAPADCTGKTLSFQVYGNADLIGIELSGVLKNVIAIAAGIVDGLGYGINSLAALVTRGLVEISRLGIKLGASPRTFSGLAGMGDLILTCFGKLSRNRYVGFHLGKGESIEEITSRMRMVAEGVGTTWSAYQLAKKEQVEMPIVEKVYEIIYRKKQGFSVPVVEWFFERLGDFTKQKLLDFSKRTDFLDKQYVEEMLTAQRGMKLWYILNFALWHERWIENIYL